MEDNLTNDMEFGQDEQPDSTGREEAHTIQHQSEKGYRIIALDGMYENWFLDYASYVILERAVPDVMDGLKPVQRRILHAMYEMDDGRYNKVANIIGQTMKYHPHGDASIGEALVQLGQKELLIDTQGNWGNILTGDSAAAPRYIEARLSKFALEVAFNPKTTKWKDSYDGRNHEPVFLPLKFPLLLAQGVEGIAVGLASKILPHNFIELIDASIKYLQGKDFDLLPDFPGGGLADFSRYNRGLRGGKVRIRARIKLEDKKNLIITEIPFGTTTTNLIDSIVSASDKGKIKIKKIDDNTSDKVEIQIQLQPGISPDQTIDALYAFTNCEISVSPNACVIYDGKPHFIGVDEILKISTDNTVNLLKMELEIRKNELEELWHFSSLEKIFIEERIYRDIEECETWDAVIVAIDHGLEPFKHLFKRQVTREDIIRLTEIKIKRISKYNAFKADETIRGIEIELEEVDNHLHHLIDFAINYFLAIKKKYGKGKERLTEIRNFDNIEATMVAAANEKLYVNREEGFAGTGLKKDEYVCDCSDIDEIIAFREDGTYLVTKVAPKFFVGKNIIHIDVFKRNDERTIYNAVYRDGRTGAAFVKRFAVTSITRDKEYNLTKGEPDSKVLYFSANPNGEAEIVTINLKPKPRLKKTTLDFDFSTLAIKGRNSLGNILTKNTVRKIVIKEEGISTLGAMNIWFDDSVKRLNTEERGLYIGAFKGNDKIVSFMQSGDFRITGFDLTTHFDSDVICVRKYNPEHVFTAVYLEGETGLHYIKRFSTDDTDKKTSFINGNDDSKLITLSADHHPVLKIIFDRHKNGKEIAAEIIQTEEFIGIKSYKAKGKRLSGYFIENVEWLQPPEIRSDNPVDAEWNDSALEEEETEVSHTDNQNESVEQNPETDFFTLQEISDADEKDFPDQPVAPSKVSHSSPPPPKKKPKHDNPPSQMSLF